MGAFEYQWVLKPGESKEFYIVIGCINSCADAPIWLVSCMCAIIQQCGNIDLLERKAGFIDSTEKASVYQHMLKAIYYLAGENTRITEIWVDGSKLSEDILPNETGKTYTVDVII